MLLDAYFICVYWKFELKNKVIDLGLHIIIIWDLQINKNISGYIFNSTMLQNIYLCVHAQRISLYPIIRFNFKYKKKNNVIYFVNHK